MSPRLNEGGCGVHRCIQPQRNKGLCSWHYQEYLESKEHHREVELWEANNSLEPLSYSAYVQRVRGIVRGLPVSKQIRNNFTSSMYAAYRRGSQ